VECCWISCFQICRKLLVLDLEVFPGCLKFCIGLVYDGHVVTTLGSPIKAKDWLGIVLGNTKNELNKEVLFLTSLKHLLKHKRGCRSNAPIRSSGDLMPKSGLDHGQVSVSGTTSSSFPQPICIVALLMISKLPT